MRRWRILVLRKRKDRNRDQERKESKVSLGAVVLQQVHLGLLSLKFFPFRRRGVPADGSYDSALA
jgi:hypothetical protein